MKNALDESRVRPLVSSAAYLRFIYGLSAAYTNSISRYLGSVQSSSLTISSSLSIS